MLLKVIKRNGEEVIFEIDKIKNAIKKANNEIGKIHQLNSYQIDAIAETIEKQLTERSHAVNVEDIQDMVERGIMEMRGYEVAQKYVRYRFRREIARKSNTTDNEILTLIDRANEEVKQENSNKNPVIRSSRDSPISLRSSMMVERIFWRLTSTNGARWDKVKVWPPYWLLATWATIWVVMLQAV